MKLNRICMLAGALVVMSLISCSRGGTVIDDGGDGGPHEFVPTDITAPELSIFTPAANQVFANGNTINITGKITDDYGLYRGSVRVTNDASGLILLNQLYEIHGVLLYNFNVNHTVSVTTASDYTVTVSFEDHGLNTTTKSVKVKVNP